jgi:hypothetical protein
MTVSYSHEKLMACGNRSQGQIQEASHLVPIVLQHPQAVFQGLMRDADEPRGTREEGWLCYSGVPPNAYNEDGSLRPPWPKEVFLVFVNHEKTVYNWYWYPCDPKNASLPEGHEERFRERIL